MVVYGTRRLEVLEPAGKSTVLNSVCCAMLLLRLPPPLTRTGACLYQMSIIKYFFIFS